MIAYNCLYRTAVHFCGCLRTCMYNCGHVYIHCDPVNSTLVIFVSPDFDGAVCCRPIQHAVFFGDNLLTVARVDRIHIYNLRMSVATVVSPKITTCEEEAWNCVNLYLNFIANHMPKFHWAWDVSKKFGTVPPVVMFSAHTWLYVHCIVYQSAIVLINHRHKCIHVHVLWLKKLSHVTSLLSLLLESRVFSTWCIH